MNLQKLAAEKAKNEEAYKIYQKVMEQIKEQIDKEFATWGTENPNGNFVGFFNSLTRNYIEKLNSCLLDSFTKINYISKEKP